MVSQRALKCLGLIVAAGTLCSASLAQESYPKNPLSNKGAEVGSKLWNAQVTTRLNAERLANKAVFGQRAVATDNCADAPEIADGTHDFDTTAATNDGTATCGASGTSPDVWLSYTAAVDGTLTLATCGLTGMDTVLSVNDGCGGAQITCLDDFCGLQTQISPFLLAGQVAKIRIAGFASQVGVGQITSAFVPAGGGGPANDHCGAGNVALVIGGSVPFDSSAADNSNATVCGSGGTGPDLFYSLTSPGGGTYNIDTFGSGFDTELMALDICGGTVLACNDDSGSLQSMIQVTLAPGGSCVVQLDGFGGSFGAGSIQVAELTPPGNDNCIDADGPFGYGVHAFTNVGASTDGLPDGACLAFGSDQIFDDVWMTFVAPASEEVRFSICGGAGFDTRLAVYDGSCAGAILACNDDSTCGLQSQADVVCVAGNTYVVRIGSYIAGTQGAGTIDINPRPPIVPGDECAAPFVAVMGDNPFDTTGAVSEGGTNCGGSGPDIFYTFTPADTGNYIFSTCVGTGYDSILAIYDACPDLGGAELACNDDSCGLQSVMATDLTGGTTYIVRVDGFGGGFGAGVLNISLGVPCDLTPPGGSFPEGEDCGADTNGGCNSAGYTPIAIGQTVFGTFWADANFRDTDWYEFTLASDGDVTWRGQGEHGILLFILRQDCANPVIAFAQTALACSEVVVTTPLTAGNYWVWAGSNGFAGNPCGSGNNDYIATLQGPGGGCPADFNGDGSVDFFDYDDFVACFEGIVCPPGQDADFNNDNSVDFFDYDDFVLAFETPC